MSRTGEDDDDEEGFHDSLDRLLSSSNTSCSCSRSSSEDEDPNCNYSPEPVPRFPMGLSNKYDVWITQPSSVEERRLHLLRQMGLTKDPSLLRHRPSLSSSGCSRDLFNRSASSDHLSTSESSSNIHNNSLTLNNINSNYDSGGNTNGTLSGIVRSKSDGDSNSCKSLEFCIINSNSSSPGKEGIVGTGFPVKTDNQNNRQSHSDVEKSRIGNGSPMISAKTKNKPPKREIREDSTCNGNFSSSLTIPRKGESDDGLVCNKSNTVNGVCTIKNLDNGKEFVVKEVREDGMWKKIKEVGTGRHLTMEEFSSEMCVGTSPIVQELMRRQNVEDGINDGLDSNADGNCETGCKLKKRGNWLKSIKNMASSVTGQKERRSSDERDTSSEKGGRRSSSATDDSQDVSFHVPERVRVRQYGKSVKELTALYKSQDIQAHRGSIWTIKFSLDGKYLATAGEDCVIHVWEVVESERKGDLLVEKIEDGNFNLQFLANGSPEPSSMAPNSDSYSEKKRLGKSSISRKSVSLEQILVPETVFALLEKPICSFQGHLNDVLDLSWSKSQVSLIFALFFYCSSYDILAEFFQSMYRILPLWAFSLVYLAAFNLMRFVDRIVSASDVKREESATASIDQEMVSAAMIFDDGFLRRLVVAIDYRVKSTALEEQGYYSLFAPSIFPEREAKRSGSGNWVSN
ncbi:uncharacterized protein LOC111395087 [Olea europaea var. sylvestris]|uniref:uncharacterized protein LOC111395087 n=1 Tax=Olea europaea var. sylvestris TaxID=158386 RepID=UPI000C1D7C9B|nr:uncharacterized protein LOC111395087 [Olea europaea var. sylvestris]